MTFVDLRVKTATSLKLKHPAHGTRIEKTIALTAQEVDGCKQLRIGDAMADITPRQVEPGRSRADRGLATGRRPGSLGLCA